MYEFFWKRFLDFVISLVAVTLLLPLYVIFGVIGFFAMKGNPFFLQKRPGKNEKIFTLIKFRTMSNAKDKNGELLPDIDRLNQYGKFLRATSIDELPELFNVLIGDMSIIGPRPLAVDYLPYYNENERKRHRVRPGLTGLAQINGRNAVNWPERFAYDIDYVDHISLAMDLKILIGTVGVVLKRSDVTVRGTTKVKDFDEYRKEELRKEEEAVHHN